jgi:hypothetical protein
MSVESWDPEAGSATLDDAAMARFLGAAGRLEVPRFGLDPAAAGALAPRARHRPGVSTDWAAAAEPLSEDDLVALIRLFTLAESALSGWEAGDTSPVIPLARELKRRGRFAAELNSWIKANTDNRFLPYGNLMDRL